MSYKNLSGGDRVKFKINNGLGIVNGRTTVEKKVVSGRVVPMLTFEDHVVATHRGRPYVVDARNIVSN